MGNMGIKSVRVGTAKLGTKGRASIPPEVIKALGMEEGDFLDFEEENERIFVIRREGKKS